MRSLPESISWWPTGAGSQRLDEQAGNPAGIAQNRFWNTSLTNTFPRLPKVGPEMVRM